MTIEIHGIRIGDLDGGTPIVIRCDFDTAGVKVCDVPWAMRVIGCWIHCTEANGGGTAQLKDLDGGNAITDAIICAVDHVIQRSSTIDDAHMDLATTDDLFIQPANNAKGTAYIMVIAI